MRDCNLSFARPQEYVTGCAACRSEASCWRYKRPFFTADTPAGVVEPLDRHVKHDIEASIHDPVFRWSTNDSTAPILDEREKLTELCVDLADGKLPVVESVASTKDGIELPQHVAKIGAAALMVVPPFYDALSFE